MRTTVLLSITLAAVALSTPAWSQKPSVYPAKGQTAQQQASDDGQCQAWAKQTTGIDPAAVAASQPAATGPQGERMRGAARGAVGAEIVGGDTGTGAAVGALAGGRRARMKQAAGAEQAQASKTQAMDTYYRAWGACMQGRGYTVK